MGWLVGLVASLMLLGWLANARMLWWDTSAVGAAQLKKAQLQAELAELSANRDGWVKAGMLVKLEHCGPKAQLCVRVDESVSTFEERSDYRLFQGYNLTALAFILNMRLLGNEKYLCIKNRKNYFLDRRRPDSM